MYTCKIDVRSKKVALKKMKYIEVVSHINIGRGYVASNIALKYIEQKE